MGEGLTIEVLNTQDALAPALEKAEAWLEGQDCPPKALYFVLLAIEELVTNCTRYGYDDTGEHTIRITLSVADEMLTMTVTDDGHEFDPLTREAPDLTAAIEEREPGGLGIHMLRTMADAISYERCDGTNRLTLTKRMR